MGQGKGEQVTFVSSAPGKLGEKAHLCTRTHTPVPTLLPGTPQPRKPSGRKSEDSDHSVSSQVGTARTWGCAPPEGS